MDFALNDKLRIHQNRINRSYYNIHGIILHYFPQKNVKWEEFHNYIINDVYKPLDLEPHKAIASGGEFGQPNHMMTYKGLLRKLKKFDFRVGKYIDYVVLRPEFLKAPNVNRYLSSATIYSGMLDDDEYIPLSRITFLIDEVMLPFDFEYFCQIATKLKLLTGAAYGYYIKRPNECDPCRYAFGEDCTSTTLEEYTRNQKWQILRKSFENPELITKSLRDIYKINFLSPFHLELEAAPGQTLAQWIQAGSDKGERGSLHKIAEDFWAWYIEDESLIPTIRNQLAPSGIIICV